MCVCVFRITGEFAEASSPTGFPSVCFFSPVFAGAAESFPSDRCNHICKTWGDRWRQTLPECFLFGRSDGRDRTEPVCMSGQEWRSDHHVDSAQMCCDRRSPHLTVTVFQTMELKRLWNQRSSEDKIGENAHGL